MRIRISVQHDLILESMAKGEFSNLPGSGQPIHLHKESPHVDATTHKLNQILINNGFVPEWITLEKEIREARADLREKVVKVLSAFNQQLDSGEWAMSERKAYERRLTGISLDIQGLNRDIDKLNLIVPILQKQQFHLSLERELRRAADALSSAPPPSPSTSSVPPPQTQPQPGILRSLLHVFRAK